MEKKESLEEEIHLSTDPRLENRTLADYLAYLHWLPRSAASGILRAHAPQTVDRLLQEGPRITNYNFAEGIYTKVSTATLGAYCLTAGYMVAEHGLKGLAVLGVPLVTRLASFFYERKRKKDTKKL